MTVRWTGTPSPKPPVYVRPLLQYAVGDTVIVCLINSGNYLGKIVALWPEDQISDPIDPIAYSVRIDDDDLADNENGTVLPIRASIRNDWLMPYQKPRFGLGDAVEARVSGALAGGSGISNSSPDLLSALSYVWLSGTICSVWKGGSCYHVLLDNGITVTARVDSANIVRARTDQEAKGPRRIRVSGARVIQRPTHVPKMDLNGDYYDLGLNLNGHGLFIKTKSDGNCEDLYLRYCETSKEWLISIEDNVNRDDTVGLARSTKTIDGHDPTSSFPWSIHEYDLDAKKYRHREEPAMKVQWIGSGPMERTFIALVKPNGHWKAQDYHRPATQYKAGPFGRVACTPIAMVASLLNVCLNNVDWACTHQDNGSGEVPCEGGRKIWRLCIQVGTICFKQEYDSLNENITRENAEKIIEKASPENLKPVRALNAHFSAVEVLDRTLRLLSDLEPVTQIQQNDEGKRYEEYVVELPEILHPDDPYVIRYTFDDGEVAFIGREGLKDCIRRAFVKDLCQGALSLLLTTAGETLCILRSADGRVFFRDSHREEQWDFEGDNAFFEWLMSDWCRRQYFLDWGVRAQSRVDIMVLRANRNTVIDPSSGLDAIGTIVQKHAEILTDDTSDIEAIAICNLQERVDCAFKELPRDHGKVSRSAFERDPRIKRLWEKLMVIGHAGCTGDGPRGTITLQSFSQALLQQATKQQLEEDKRKIPSFYINDGRGCVKPRYNTVRECLEDGNLPRSLASNLMCAVSQWLHAIEHEVVGEIKQDDYDDEPVRLLSKGLHAQNRNQLSTHSAFIAEEQISSQQQPEATVDHLPAEPVVAPGLHTYLNHHSIGRRDATIKVPHQSDMQISHLHPVNDFHLNQVQGDHVRDVHKHTLGGYRRQKHPSWHIQVTAHWMKDLGISESDVSDYQSDSPVPHPVNNHEGFDPLVHHPIRDSLGGHRKSKHPSWHAEVCAEWMKEFSV